MREHISVFPMQWAPIRDLQQVEPLNDSDTACLAEIRDVLLRHGKLERFAVHLVHKHFELRDGEVMCEYTDVEHRVLKLVPKRLDEISGHIETTWMLSDSGPLAACIYACVWTKDSGAHAMQHIGKTT